MSLSRSPLRGLLFALVAVLLLGGCGTVAQAQSDEAQSDRGQKPRILRVDVAENGTRFVFDEAPLIQDGGAFDGFPAYGNAFITEGYIYPAGTLVDGNGVNPDGSPEFPDKVIGQWVCRGYFIGEGANTTEGAWVYTTQLFAFGDDPDSGAETLVVTGYEGAEVGVPVTGAITGGTGRYALARGDADQTLIGFNNPSNPDAHGINKNMTFEVVG